MIYCYRISIIYCTKDEFLKATKNREVKRIDTLENDILRVYYKVEYEKNYR